MATDTLDVMARTRLSREALDGQVAVVTGAGRGIGREAARALAWLGARLVIAELDEDGGQTTEALIREAGGVALFVPTDVSDAGSVNAMAERVWSAFGDVDLLINNAIACPVAPVVEMDVGTWDRVIAINLRGAFLTCRAFLPSMLDRGRGTLVNMVSTDAMPGLAAYIASKQGLAGFTQSLATEVGEQGIRVIAFGPGMVDTPGIRDAAPDLAPLLGITATEFLQVPLHTAYAGLMPAAHAGVATAYLVAELADIYHGEIVNGYTVLERAGVIAAPALPILEVPERADATTSGQDSRSALLEKIAEDARELRVILTQTELEFGQLPVFARPMARRGFKSKAGQSLQDWTQSVSELGDLAASGTLAGAAAPRFADLLEQLGVYYEAVPKEMARFTKDAEVLQEVARLTRERVAVIGNLVTTLRALSASDLRIGRKNASL
jgi:NAD(P)-dependent dehydrogenase (short-subunit alcohol dehydrogenase family)